MERYLVTLALFTAAMLAMLVHRIRRDTGPRADTRYLAAAAFAASARALLLAVGVLAGVEMSHPGLALASAATGLASVHFLVLFAYSFPLNREAPARLRWPLNAVTVAATVASQHRALAPVAGPFVLLLGLMPSYFVLALVFLHRNCRASIAPGERRPSAAVTLVQASLVAPWALSIAFFAAFRSVFPDRMPTWVFLAQSLGMALLVVGGTGVAVLRYHLFEIRVLMTEVVLAVAASGTLAAYVGLAAEPLHAWLSSRASPALAAVVVAGVPGVLMRALLGALDHMLQGVGSTVAGGVASRTVVEKTLAVTARLVDPDAVLAMAAAALCEATACEVRFLRAGALPPGERAEAPAELVALARQHPRAFYSPAHAPELPQGLLDAMCRLDAQLVVPVQRNEALYGFFAVSSAQRCSRAEALVCAAVADHLALKFENYALFAEAAQASREIAGLSRELEESRRLAALGAFAAAVAHDIRTPLTSIQMNVQILRSRAELPEGDREYLDITLTEIDRLERSVGEILEYARPVSLAVEPVDARELAADVVRALAPVYAERGVAVTLAPGEAAVAPMDERHVRKALVNLIDNAADASPRGAEVEVRAGAAGGGVFLAVRDRGRGIDPDQLERIFEPFFTTRPDGTGLGLAIARKIVRAHGGELRVESAPGEGSTFTAVLPGATS